MILVETHPIRRATFGCCLARSMRAMFVGTAASLGAITGPIYSYVRFGIDSSSEVENALGNRQGVKISGWKREGRRETRAPAPARARPRSPALASARACQPGRNRERNLNNSIAGESDAR